MVVSPAPMCLGGASTGLKCPSSVMTKTDPELQRFLPQGAFGSLHNLRKSSILAFLPSNAVSAI